MNSAASIAGKYLLNYSKHWNGKLGQLSRIGSVAMNSALELTICFDV